MCETTFALIFPVPIVAKYAGTDKVLINHPKQSAIVDQIKNDSCRPINTSEIKGAEIANKQNAGMVK